MDVSLRRLRAEDIDQVVEIEREAFSPLWVSSPFKRELNNRYASYLVASRSENDREADPPEEDTRCGGPWSLYGRRQSGATGRMVPYQTRMISASWNIGPMSIPSDGLEYSSGGTPMSARYRSPTCLRASSDLSPALGSANVSVAAARIAGSYGRPVVVSTPLGVSNESTGAS